MCHTQCLALLDSTKAIAAALATAITELFASSRNSVVIVLDVVLGAWTRVQLLTANVLLSKPSTLSFALFFAGVAVCVATATGVREGDATSTVDVVKVSGDGFVAGADVIGEIADLFTRGWRLFWLWIGLWLLGCYKSKTIKYLVLKYTKAQLRLKFEP